MEANNFAPSNIAIPCEFGLTCTVSKLALFSKASIWLYERTATGAIESVKANGPVNIIDAPVAVVALKACIGARIDRNVAASLIMSHKFRTPRHDDEATGAHAYGVFFDQRGVPMTPYAPDGRARLMVDPTCVSPDDDKEPSYVGPETDDTRGSVVLVRGTDAHVLIFMTPPGNSSFESVYHETDDNGEPIMPVDNKMERFILARGSTVEPTPTALVIAEAPRHMGQCVLGIIQHYVGDTVSSSDGADADVASDIVEKVVAVLASTLNASSAVQKAVLDQLVEKAGEHVFQESEGQHSVYEVLVHPAHDHPVALRVFVDYAFAVGKQGGSEPPKMVTLKRLPVTLVMV
jgi:hypothetical protein